MFALNKQPLFSGVENRLPDNGEIEEGADQLFNFWEEKEAAERQVPRKTQRCL